MRNGLWCAAAALLAWAGAARAGDWAHWRGPEMNGHSRETNLPEEWSPETPGKNNLVWKQPYGCRSAPIVLGGRLYIIHGTGEGLQEGEQVTCFDAETGKVLWEHKFNVFHTDIVSSRLGWCSMCGDPETGYVYAHGTQGFLFCFDKDGKVVWRRQLTEEYGRVTGYGGRISNPTVDEDLVIVGIINASWGDQARGWNRWAAFDKKTGEVVWWSQTPEPQPGTYYSNPVVAVINGERLLISGGSDGGLHAFQVRTGKHVWSYPVAGGIVNGSPIVEGNLVYVTHGESNLGSATRGGVYCIDASQVKDGRPKLVWKYEGRLFGLASAAFADGKLYCPDDFAKLCCFDGKTGKLLWRYSYGRVARGSPLVADGKIYIFDVNAGLHILGLEGDEEPEELHYHKFINPKVAGFVETNGTPIAVNGKVYFGTADTLYCIGNDKPHPEPKYRPLPPEPSAEGDAEIAQVLVYPAEVTLAPGQSQEFSLRFYNARGQRLGLENARVKVEWSLPQPPKAKGPPAPALKGEIDGSGRLTVDPKVPNQQGYVLAKVGGHTARARVRVAPPIPYADDFERYPLGGCPGGWVYAEGKFVVVDKDGSKVLMKTNTSPRPPLARANGYITPPDATGYTIACDVMAELAHGKLPDAGLVNCRYTLVLDGKKDSPQDKRNVRIGSWEAIPRINHPAEFDWKENVWYRMKLRVEQRDGKAVVRGKVWERDRKEPEGWTVEFTDPNPNKEGAAAIYGFVTNVLADEPGSPIYYDNLEITPNGK